MTFPERGWEKYINMLSAINNTAAKKFTAYLNTHETDTRLGRQAAIDYAYAIATQYGESAAAASCEMYEAVAEASGVAVPPAVPADTAPYSDVAKAVNGLKKQNASNEMLGDSIGRLVKRAGADTTLKNAIRDGAECAWIPHGDTCAFCIMLASNGWQRASRKTLKGDHAEHIHANCNCEFAIRFDGKSNVAGYDPDKYKEMWDNTDGRTWQEKLQNLRHDRYQEYYKENKADILAHKREKYALENKKDKAPREWNESEKDLLDTINANEIEYNEVKRANNRQTDDDIIAKIGGGDMTAGSCVSLSFAYAGNKCGYDVTDFRGGSSQSVFSRTSNIKKILGFDGVKSVAIQEGNDFTGALELLKTIEENGKEYILVTGQHAAVIRKKEIGFEYLELQTVNHNGYHNLTKEVLKDRFGCKRSHSSYGKKVKLTNMLIDVDSLADSDAFAEMLGYINTDIGKQKKGALGSAK